MNVPANIPRVSDLASAVMDDPRSTSFVEYLSPDFQKELAREVCERAIRSETYSDDLFDFIWTYGGQGLAYEYRAGVEVLGQ